MIIRIRGLVPQHRAQNLILVSVLGRLILVAVFAWLILAIPGLASRRGTSRVELSEPPAGAGGD